MPRPIPNSKWINSKGNTIIVDELWFWVKGDYLVFRDVVSGKRYEVTLKDTEQAIKEGKLKMANDW